MYDSDVVGPAAIVPGIALAGVVVGVDALLLLVVSIVLVSAFLYRWRGRARGQS